MQKGISMATTLATPITPSVDTTRTDWVAVARQLGPTFAARATAHDANDTFVADNYADLKQHKVFSAGVPTLKSMTPGRLASLSRSRRAA